MADLNISTTITRPVGKTLFVDSVNGNDSTGTRGDASKPFLTITAAKTDAIAGDLINVGPGLYDEYDLVKDGINYYFQPGAKVIYTGTPVGGHEAIFNTLDSDVVSTFGVYGYGHFEWAAGGGVGYVCYWQASDSVVRIYADHVASDSSDLLGAAVGTNMDIVMAARTGVAANDAFYGAHQSGYVTMRIDQITAGASLIISEGYGVFDIFAQKIECNRIGSSTNGELRVFSDIINHSYAGPSFSHEGGTSHFFGTDITARHADGFFGNVFAAGLAFDSTNLITGANAANCIESIGGPLSITSNNASTTDRPLGIDVTCLGDMFYNTGGPSDGQIKTANADGTWSWEAPTGGGAVSSVNGLTGAVSLDTSNVSDTSNKRYVTDADLVKLGNTSGTNTGDETAQRIGDLVNGATEKTTPVDADMVGLMDSAASNILKKLSWANIKATLKTYFDTLYFGRNTSTLSSDFTTNSATYTNITGLSVTLEANSTYMIWITTPYSSPATATGVGISMTVTGSPTLRNVTRTQWTNTTVINSSNFSADDAGSIGTTVGTANVIYGCTFLCTFVTAGSSCVVQMRAARGGTSNTISIKAGATIVAVKIL